MPPIIQYINHQVSFFDILIYMLFLGQNAERLCVCSRVRERTEIVNHVPRHAPRNGAAFYKPCAFAREINKGWWKKF